MLNTNRTYTAQNGETIFDVANRVYGHIDGVVWLCEDNDIKILPYDFGTEERSDVGGKKFYLREAVVSQRTINELDFYPKKTK
jgi:hypothetical protein